MHTIVTMEVKSYEFQQLFQSSVHNSKMENSQVETAQVLKPGLC
jgi:hypothetical protein